MVIPSSQVPAVLLKRVSPHWPMNLRSASMAKFAPSRPPLAASRSNSAWSRSNACGIGGSPPPASSTSTSLLNCHRSGRSSRRIPRSVTRSPTSIPLPLLQILPVRAGSRVDVERHGQGEGVLHQVAHHCGELFGLVARHLEDELVVDLED